MHLLGHGNRIGGVVGLDMSGVVDSLGSFLASPRPLCEDHIHISVDLLDDPRGVPFGGQLGVCGSLLEALDVDRLSLFVVRGSGVGARVMIDPSILVVVHDVLSGPSSDVGRVLQVSGCTMHVVVGWVGRSLKEILEILPSVVPSSVPEGELKGRDACRGMAGGVVGPCAGEEELLYLRAVPLVPLDGLGEVGLHRLVRLLR